MGQAGPATRGQVRRKARRSGQIRSESPGPPEPILAAVHPEPPQRHTHKSVDTRVGVRTRSDQAVTLDAALSAVHVSPENRKVVRPRGSQRGSAPGTFPPGYGPRARRSPLSDWLLPTYSPEGRCQGLIRVYVDQALSPTLVARRSDRPLMPYRRRITIRRQSGGGHCSFRGHPGPGGHGPVTGR